MPEKLSIVIPALNEEKNIIETIAELQTAIGESGDIVEAHEIIVVDDHSADNTFGTVAEDAWRRDLTINALFYDIANFTIQNHFKSFTFQGSRHQTQ